MRMRLRGVVQVLVPTIIAIIVYIYSCTYTHTHDARSWRREGESDYVCENDC